MGNYQFQSLRPTYSELRYSLYVVDTSKISFHLVFYYINLPLSKSKKVSNIYYHGVQSITFLNNSYCMCHSYQPSHSGLITHHFGQNGVNKYNIRQIWQSVPGYTAYWDMLEFVT